MPGCAFNNCTNHSKRINKSHGITFHQFPHDELLKFKWVEIVRDQKRDYEWVPKAYSSICSIHFKSSDMYKTSKGYTRITKGAVPFFKASSKASSQPSTSEADVPPADDEELNSDDDCDESEGLTRCAECRESIHGCMFVCVQCTDSNWCSVCAHIEQHPEHYLIRVPAHRPQNEINKLINTLKTLINNVEATETEIELEIEKLPNTGSAASALNEYYEEMGRSEDNLTVVDETDDEDAPSTQDEAAPSAQGEANKEELVVVVKNEIQCEVDPLMSSTTDVQTEPQLYTEIKQEPIEIPIETHSHTQQIPETTQMSKQNNPVPNVLKYRRSKQSKTVLLTSDVAAQTTTELNMTQNVPDTDVKKFVKRKRPAEGSTSFHVFTHKKKPSADAGPS